MRNETPERAAARRRTTRSEVDQFASGPRLPGGGREGFDTAQSDVNPGGRSGEHSGQVLPAAGADVVEAGDDREDDPEDEEAPETPTDEPPPVPIVDPPADATPGPPLTAAGEGSPRG